MLRYLGVRELKIAKNQQSVEVYRKNKAAHKDDTLNEVNDNLTIINML